MREIKFRAKSAIDNNWIYGLIVPLVVLDGADEAHYLNPYWIATGCENECGPVKEETVGQLLFIRDGKEFYEGDIIADTLPLSNEFDLENCYLLTWENFKDVMPTGHIVGNAVDNADLLYKVSEDEWSKIEYLEQL